MKLGYLVPEFPSQTHVFFWREVLALRELGVEVHLLSSRRPAPDACRHDFAAAARAETHYVFPPRWTAAVELRPRRLLRALAYVAGLRETRWPRRLVSFGLIPSALDLVHYSRQTGIEHIHAHSCGDVAHLTALCRRLGGPPYSLTLHGDLLVYGRDHASKMRSAQFVVCVTAALKQQVAAEVGLPPERVPVIWMGVDTAYFREGGRRRFEAGRLHLVTVARLQLNKGHRHALAAMRAALDRGLDLHYTIAGEGPDRPAIEAEVRRLGLQDRVELTGTLAEGEIIPLLQAADAFVLPSVGLGEAAPVAIMEAMACGLPVVCSRIGGTPDMITAGVNGLLTPQGDEGALAEAFILLAENVAERRRLGEAARKRAVQAFDSREGARRLLEAIRAAG